MLTRRIFQRLTDAALFDHARPIVPICAAHCCRIKCSQNSTPIDLSFFPRRATTSSSTRWKSRQTRDRYAKEAKVSGLKSRAAFKLLELDQKYHLFKPGQTVVDLGYAPGSWSQVAVTKTSPGGRVIGIDILPVQPPKGVSTIQGNFLSKAVQDEVRAYVQDPDRGRPKTRRSAAEEGLIEEEDMLDERGYIDMERHADLDFSREEAHHTSSSSHHHGDTSTHQEAAPQSHDNLPPPKLSLKQRDATAGRTLDLILSDMSAPWPQTTGTWSKSISNPYHRLQNTSGIPFKDHAGSMDLCSAALSFAFDTLKTGGSFVCKFYAGAEDKALEGRLRRCFERVVREKPESSRSESKEAYFVALRRIENAVREEVVE